MALNRHASFDNLSGSRSSFKTTTPNALSRNRKRVLSEDFSLLHQDDFCSHPVGAVVGLPSSFATTTLLSQKKKLRHSLSQDAANQESQSPRWAPGLATSIKNFIPPTPKASFSLHPVLTLIPLVSLSLKKSHLLMTMNRIVWGGIGIRKNFQIRAHWVPLYQARAVRHSPWLVQ